MIETQKQFVRALKKMGPKNDISVAIIKGKGKGGHQTAFYGTRRTTVQTGVIPRGTYRAMCRQLGIAPRDLEKYG